MPRLIYKGDTISNFGKFLPAPYIDRIYVKEGSTIGDNLEINVSFMLIVEDGVNDDDLINDLSSLHIYFLAVYDSDEIQSVIDREENVFTLFSEITLPTVTHPMAVAAVGEWYIQGTFQDLAKSDETLYDENNNRIVRLVGTYTLSKQYWVTTSNLTLFAFTSIVDYSSDDISSELGNITLLNQKISNISYERVFEDGDLANQTEVAYLDSAATVYDGIPLQSITSQYYKAEKITHEDIVDSINELLAEYEVRGTAKPRLQDHMDAISYVLSVYGQSPELLPQLNLLKKTFASKSTVIDLGKLYVRYRRRIYNLNQSVMENAQLFKQLIINPKIVDLRAPLSSEWSERTVADLDCEDLIYTNWLVSSEAFRSQESTEYDPADKISTYGYFFFDYEKLIHHSDLAHILDISAFESLFGQEILNDKLKVKKAKLHRYYDTTYGEGATEGGTWMSNFDPDGDGTGVDVWEILMKMNTVLSDNPATAYVTYYTGDDYSVIKEDGSTLYSYLMLRNFDLASSAGLEGYRLMCFEFQDLYSLDAIENSALPPWLSETEVTELDYPSGQLYTATIEVEDNTLDIISTLTSSYQSATLDFTENYYDLAHEACSYNNIDGRFNQFFIDAIETEYVDNLDLAPWIRMPIIYNLHRDILFNMFGGDSNRIIEVSKGISDRINPRAGTLERLDAFKTMIDDLFTHFYEEGTDLSNLISTLDSDGRTFECSISYDDFPAVYNEVIELVEDPSTALRDHLDDSGLVRLFDVRDEAAFDKITVSTPDEGAEAKTKSAWLVFVREEMELIRGTISAATTSNQWKWADDQNDDGYNFDVRITKMITWWRDYWYSRIGSGEAFLYCPTDHSVVKCESTNDGAYLYMSDETNNLDSKWAKVAFYNSIYWDFIRFYVNGPAQEDLPSSDESATCCYPEWDQFFYDHTSLKPIVYQWLASIFWTIDETYGDEYFWNEGGYAAYYSQATSGEDTTARTGRIPDPADSP